MCAFKPSASCCCPTYRIIELLSRKWCMHIVRAIAEAKVIRYTEVQEALPEINSRMLSERLGELEEEGIIERRVQNTKPITIEYVLTEKGQDLQKVFDVFCRWGKKWGPHHHQH